MVVAQGPWPAALAGILLCGVIWYFRPRDRGSDEKHALAFALLLVSLLAMPSSALRIHANVTVSDAVLVLSYAVLAGGALAGLAKGERLPRLPVWLLIGGGGLAVAAMLVELFPPDRAVDAAQAAATSLYTRTDPTAPTNGIVSTSNALMAGRLTIALLGVPLLLGLLGNSRRRVQLMLRVWLIGVAINCVVAVLGSLQIVSAADIVGREYGLVGAYEADRLAGLTVHPVLLGTIAAIALPVVFVRLTNRVRLADAVLALLFMLGIMVSGTRAAAVGAVIGVAATLVIQRGLRVRGSLIAFSAVCTAVVVVITNGGVFAIVDRLASGSRSAEASDLTRRQAQSDSFQAILERPVIGHGFQVIKGAHNLYLEMAHAGGLIALAAFLFFAGGLLQTGLRMARDQRAPPMWRVESCGLVGAVVAWLTLSLFQASVFDRYLYIPAGIVIAMALVARREAASAPAEAGPRRGLAEVGAGDDVARHRHRGAAVHV